MSKSDEPIHVRLRLDEIIIDKVRHPRVRGTPEQLRALADNIDKVGVLHLPIVNSKKELVLGRRRLKAHELLGREYVWCRVLDSLDDQLAALLAEQGENTCRVPLSLSESARLARGLRAAFQAQARERQREGGKTAGRGRPREIASADSAEANGEAGDSRDQIASAVGLKRDRLEKVEEVVAAAEQDPTFCDLVKQMDAGKISVNRAYNTILAHQPGVDRPRSDNAGLAGEGEEGNGDAQPGTGRAGPETGDVEPAPPHTVPYLHPPIAVNYTGMAKTLHSMARIRFDGDAALGELGVEKATALVADIQTLTTWAHELGGAINAAGVPQS
jgi:hypothetical protein